MARSGPRPPAPRIDQPDGAIAAVVAGFHHDVSERLLEGARERLAEAGISGELTVRWVPGAFELPLAAQTLASTGRYAAIVALGAVVRGETAHFDHICHVAATGLGRVSLDSGVPCAFGVLTCDTLEQAEARSGGAVGNAGADAADAAVIMANLVSRERTT